MTISSQQFIFFNYHFRHRCNTGAQKGLVTIRASSLNAKGINEKRIKCKGFWSFSAKNSSARNYTVHKYKMGRGPNQVIMSEASSAKEEIKSGIPINHLMDLVDNVYDVYHHGLHSLVRLSSFLVL